MEKYFVVRLHMIPDTNLYIESYAGCGKTTRLFEYIKELSGEKKRVLVLSFNKSIRIEICKKLYKFNLDKSQFYNKEEKKELFSKFEKDLDEDKTYVYEKLIKEMNINVQTFHSLMYSEVTKNFQFEMDLLHNTNDFTKKEILILNQLKNDYKNNISKMIEDAEDDEELNLRDIMNVVEKIWLKYSDKSSLNNYDYIVLDEFQDVSGSLLKILDRLICNNRMNDVKIIAAGDERQRIYGFADKKKVVFFNWFEKQGEFEVETLKKCYRCSPSIQKFINGLYEKKYKSENMFDLSYYKNEDYMDDVFISSIQHKNLLSEKVKQIVDLYPDKKIMIMGRINKELIELKEIYKDNENIEVTTIHKQKGRQSDVVILVNTMYGDDIEEDNLNVWNVGLSRAKDKLHIITSFPEEQIKSMFVDGTYVLESEQKKLSDKTYEKFEDLEMHLTREKCSKSVVDSIIIQIPVENAPYLPFLRQNVEKKCKFITSRNNEYNKFKYLVKYHNNLVSFEFCDLNYLKNRSMTDRQIINFLSDVVKDFFGGLISEEEINKMSVRRMDLCQLYQAESDKILDDLKELFCLSKYDSSNEKVNECPADDGSSKTTYLNCTSLDSRVLRLIRSYFSDMKSINRIEGKNVLKVEIEKNFVKGKSCSKQSNLTFGDVRDKVEYKGLRSEYREWLRDEFNHIYKEITLYEKDEIKNYSLMTKEEIISIISNGKHDVRRKRILFYTYLIKLNDSTYNLLKDIFDISFDDLRKECRNLKSKLDSKNSIDSKSKVSKVNYFEGFGLNEINQNLLTFIEKTDLKHDYLMTVYKSRSLIKSRELKGSMVSIDSMRLRESRESKESKVSRESRDFTGIGYSGGLGHVKSTYNYRENLSGEENNSYYTLKSLRSGGKNSYDDTSLRVNCSMMDKGRVKSTFNYRSSSP